MRVTLGNFWASFGPYRRRMAGVMRIGAGLVGLKAKMCTAFEPEAKSKGARRRQPNEVSSEPEWFFGHFGATLHPLGAFGDHLRATLCT